MISAPANGLSDGALMTRVADGDVFAFEAIYRRYRKLALGHAVRVTGRAGAAEEVTQDAFLSLWRSARRFDPSRGNLNTWLFALIRNRSIDWMRRGARHERNVAIDGELIERIEAGESTEQEVDRLQASHDLRRMLKALPTAQREVIELGYFKGLSHTEIASRVDIPLGTVKGRQRLALEKLKRTLAREALAS